MDLGILSLSLHSSACIFATTSSPCEQRFPSNETKTRPLVMMPAVFLAAAALVISSAYAELERENITTIF